MTHNLSESNDHEPRPYLRGSVRRASGFVLTGDSEMHIIGVIEMIVGLAILTRWTQVDAYVASAWLLAIAINLVSTGMFFDIAVR